MIVDGKKLAEKILVRTKARAEKLPRRPQVVAYAPSDTPAARSYLKIKQKYAAEAGCDFRVVTNITEFADADACIIQLPLPVGISNDILNSIPLEKDADVLSSVARAQFEATNLDIRCPSLLPPVVAAIKEIFDANKVEVRGRSAVVIGNGFLVGAPAATWLKQQGAIVEIIDIPSDSAAVARATLATADIIVSGAGSSHLIKPDMIKNGVVLIDAGTSESSGVIVGDADPACADKCSIFTPVPGGVGPISVACLFANAVTLAERVDSSIIPT